MTASAIVTTVIFWLIFIGALGWCFSRFGKVGKWED